MFDTRENRRLFVFGAITIILSVMALINNLLTADYEQWIAITALAFAALVFALAFAVDREAYAAVGFYIMLAIIGIILITGWLAVEGVLVPTYVLTAVALPFMGAWLFNRQNWGMLIPAYVLLAIIPILYLGENVTPELVPAYVLTAVGLPFFVAFLFSHKWAWFVPSAILFVIAASFVGLAFGMPTAFMSIGLPVITLLVGLILLLRAMTQTEERKEI
jgi:hypothetical protein